MNYIKKVIIENFQSHEYTEIDFSSGLNVIVGPSDQGKSAIIRAIKWALFNEPRGNEFIRQGTSFARVSLEINNGSKIIRERSSSKNRYTLVRPDGESSVFEGFGNEVPQEITKADGISKIMIDTDSNVSLNLGEQLEGPFLISETGAVRAKAIGRLTGVHIIDKAIRDCISDLKREYQSESRCSKELEEIEIKLKAFDNLKLLEDMIAVREQSIEKIEVLLKQFESLKKFKNRLDEVESQSWNSINILNKLEKLKEAEINIYKLSEKKTVLDKLNQLRTNFSLIKYELKIQEGIVNTAKDVNTLNKKIQELQSKTELIKKLKKLSEDFKINTENISRVNKSLQKLSAAKMVEDNINKLSEAIKKINKFYDLSKRYNEVNKSISEGNLYKSKVSNDIKEYLKMYENELKKISKCPVCFSKIEEKTIYMILSQYKEEQ